LSMGFRNKHELLLNQLKPRRGKPPDHAGAIHNNWQLLIADS